MEFGEYYAVYFIASLVIAAGLGLIPANIAQRKGYSFGLWWFYGWMLFIIAFIHSLSLSDKNSAPIAAHAGVGPVAAHAGVGPVADEIKKYKTLADEGVITHEEFAAKKERLLKQI